MISKMIVENFNGLINFSSIYKKGSIFYFTFQAEDVSEKEMSDFI